MNKKPFKIYVVGYPKSGTSWLSRLLAHALGIPIWSDKENIEVTSEINERIKEMKENSFILKLHSRPKDLFGIGKANPSHIVYIYRDFKAVFISSFFYFRVPKRYAFLFTLKDNPLICNRKRLLRWILYPFSRVYFCLTLYKVVTRGVSKGKFGIWKKQVSCWKNLANQEKINCNIVYVSYEDLLDNPKTNLSRIIQELNLKKINDIKLKKAVKEESFGQMKARLNEKSSLVERALLREGKKDDWKNYLSKINLLQIKKIV